MSEYTFSYYVMQVEPKLVRRPWWKVFGRDRIVMEQNLTRKSVAPLSASEAALLQRGDVALLIQKVLLPEAHSFQLEQSGPVSSYVSTAAAMAK